MVFKKGNIPWNLGIPHTEITKNNIKISLKGKIKYKEKHHCWKGMKAGYDAKHRWIKQNYGKANYCENIYCLNKSNRFDWANISGKYLREKSDYKQLCAICHHLMDWGNYCRKGHEYTKENTYHPRLKPQQRRCRECNRMGQIKRRSNAKKNSIY